MARPNTLGTEQDNIRVRCPGALADHARQRASAHFGGNIGAYIRWLITGDKRRPRKVR